jgi:hypothetical protein
MAHFSTIAPEPPRSTYDLTGLSVHEVGAIITGLKALREKIAVEDAVKASLGHDSCWVGEIDAILDVLPTGAVFQGLYRRNQ